MKMKKYTRYNNKKCKKTQNIIKEMKKDMI